MPFSVFCSFLFLFSTFLYSQQRSNDPYGYNYILENQIKATPVKDQGNSAYCWSYCTLSMLESELLSKGKGEYDLSEIFIVRNCYIEKAIKYARMHGLVNFSAGGAMYDAIDILRNYGLMPEEAMNRTLKIDPDTINFLLKNFISGMIKKNEELTNNWEDQFSAILDSCFGKIPGNFYYKGETFSPTSFAESLSLNMDDYMVVTSFTHHPFYKSFALEVPDNWACGEAYNLPLQEFGEVVKESLKHGYSFAWSGDITEPGFSYPAGIAVVIENDTISAHGNEKANRLKAGKREQYFDKSFKEKEITQGLRQKAFDNYQTTDDHGLHITGMVKDQRGNTYYLAKNSWGTDNIYGGYMYVSEAYLLYKTTSILINRNALPGSIKAKLNLPLN